MNTLIRFGMILLFLPLTVSAADVYWKSVNGSYSGDWNDPNHWDAGRVPTADDWACFSKNMSGDVLITVNENHDAMGIWFDSRGGGLCTVTLRGSGELHFKGTGASQIGSLYYVILDGVSWLWDASANMQHYGTLELKTGARVTNSRVWNMWKGAAQFIVNGGSVTWTGALQYYETSANAALLVNSGSVYSQG